MSQSVTLYNICGEASALLYVEEQSFKKPFERLSSVSIVMCILLVFQDIYNIYASKHQKTAYNIKAFVNILVYLYIYVYTQMDTPIFSVNSPMLPYFSSL